MPRRAMVEVKAIKYRVTWVECPRLLPDFPMSVITRSCDQGHNPAIPLESDFIVVVILVDSKPQRRLSFRANCSSFARDTPHGEW
jgi:hypothetical protein